MDILEIEIKSPCSDHDAVIEKARALGAGYSKKLREVDLYLNHPARDFRDTDEALRLRQVNNSVILTYKGPKLGTKSKTRVEKEVAVEDFNAVLEILELLGFIPSGTIEKEREIFTLGDVEICIDRVDGLGNFVELEMKGADREGIERKLFGIAGQLGLDQFETKSYLELKYNINRK